MPSHTTASLLKKNDLFLSALLLALLSCATPNAIAGRVPPVSPSVPASLNVLVQPREPEPIESLLRLVTTKTQFTQTVALIGHNID